MCSDQHVVNRYEITNRSQKDALPYARNLSHTCALLLPFLLPCPSSIAHTRTKSVMCVFACRRSDCACALLQSSKFLSHAHDRYQTRTLLDLIVITHVCDRYQTRTLLDLTVITHTSDLYQTRTLLEMTVSVSSCRAARPVSGAGISKR